jgi:rhamnulokinase
MYLILSTSKYMKNTFLAFDLGTSVGRAVIGELSGGILSLHEIHQFENEPILAEDHRFWNIELLFEEIKKSLVIVADQNLPVESIGITAWGVDFSVMSDGDIPLRPIISPDVKNEDHTEGFVQRISDDKIYGQTGIPVSHVTSLFQLAAFKKTESEMIKKAKHLLFMPDIFNYLLTGILQTEFSIATTSQLYNPVKRMWDQDLYKALGIPVSIMSRLVEPGSIIGSVSNKVSYETGIARIPVVAVVSNAEASAIAAIPASGDKWVYINTGSICTVGFESARPIINKKSQQLNFTNQGGAGHNFNIQKNIAGLWLLEECRKAWKENKYSIADLAQLAGESKPFAAFIDTEHESFKLSTDLPAAVTDYLIYTGQDAPQSHGEIIRIILEGLAFKFKTIIGQIEDLRGVKSEGIYITGEGTTIELLCQFTANCCGIPVIASPDKAIVTGNILVQAMALGIVKNVTEIRGISAKSFPSKTFQPSEKGLCDEAFKQYMQITASK